jgi:transposase
MTNLAKSLYIGIDTHKKDWTVTILTDALEHKTFRQSPEPEQLVKYVSKNFPDNKVHCCYEAGFCGYWIYESLLKAGFECKVVNPSDIPTTGKEIDQKTDPRDSRKIAVQLRSGILKGIYVPDKEQQEFRTLFGHRNNLTKDMRRIKSRIKGQLNFYGIKIPAQYDNKPNWSANFIAWLKTVLFSHELAKLTIDSLIRQLEFLRIELYQCEKQLRLYAKNRYQQEYELLMSIPGIGPIVATAILAEVGNINRFNKLDQPCSYIGIIPSIYSSSDKKHVRGITSRAKLLLRSYLIESAWVAARKDPAMQDYYLKHYKSMKSNKIIIKVTRKLVSRMMVVLRDKKPYELRMAA